MLMRWADWFFRDKRSGRIVVGQWPNLPLWLFGVTRLLAMLTEGPVRNWAWLLSEAALLCWAGDELARGVNPWRRCLGAGVLLWIAYSWATRAVS
jgi:hypothetical protein